MKKIVILFGILGLFSLGSFAEGALRGEDNVAAPAARKLSSAQAPNRVLATQFNAMFTGGPFGFAEDYMGNDAGYYARNVITWGGLAVAALGQGVGGDMGEATVKLTGLIVGGVNIIWSIVRGYQIKDCSWTNDAGQSFDDC